MRSNGGHLLALLRDNGAMSRADLARAIGVSAPALTKLAGGLLDKGLVTEGESTAVNGLGRPPTLITLNPTRAYIVGANVGPGRVGIVLTDMMLGVQRRGGFRFDFETTEIADLVGMVSGAINAVIEKSGLPRQAIKGIGVGVPGKVDRTGRWNVNSKFAEWMRDVPFADDLEAQLGLPVVLEHNATAMALVEAHYGLGRGHDTILHLYMRLGLGAGLVHTRYGERTHPGPVEIGHIVVEPQGIPCQCGARGCLETLFCEPVLLKALGLDAVPPQGIVAAAMDVPAVWERAYGPFVEAVATTITLLGPDLVLLGGHLGEAPDRFVSQLRIDLLERLMPQFKRLRIERAQLQPDAGALGAACVGLEKFIFEG